MKKDEAIRLAVDAVDATKQTHYVLRRGDSYDASAVARRGYAVAEMIGTGNVQNYRPEKFSEAMTRVNMRNVLPPKGATHIVHKTRFAELGYWKIEDGCWSVVDLTDGKTAQVGQHYPSKETLLANLENYASDFGCALAKPAQPLFRQHLPPCNFLKAAKNQGPCNCEAIALSFFEPKTPKMDALEVMMAEIAKKRFNIDTLEPRHSDSLDFHDVAVWSITDALMDAYQAGADSIEKPSERLLRQLRDSVAEAETEPLRKALKTISSLWPEPPNCADILSVNGINDGKSRAILADAAIKIARKALEDAKCLCVVGCSVNGDCPLHGDFAKRLQISIQAAEDAKGPTEQQLQLCEQHCGAMGKGGFHSLLCPLSGMDHPSRPGNTYKGHAYNSRGERVAITVPGKE